MVKVVVTVVVKGVVKVVVVVMVLLLLLVVVGKRRATTNIVNATTNTNYTHTTTKLTNKIIFLIKTATFTTVQPSLQCPTITIITTKINQYYYTQRIALTQL